MVVVLGELGFIGTVEDGGLEVVVLGARVLLAIGVLFESLPEFGEVLEPCPGRYTGLTGTPKLAQVEATSCIVFERSLV